MFTPDSKFVENLKNQASLIEEKMSDASGAARHNAMRQLIKEHSRLKRLSEKAEAILAMRAEYDEYAAVLAREDSDAELRELARAELPAMEKKLARGEKEFMESMLPPDPSDERNAIMEIRAGTGGQEAALFAADLYRMYSRHSEISGWKTELMDAAPSDLGGYKEIVFAIRGDNVYGRLRFEAGTHRVQRIPVTEGAGRIHTSAATVAVLPEADESDDLQIRPEDIKTDVFRASGAGGQHVNKTDSAVRITHLPSGIVVKSQDERSQHRNRERAMGILRARLLALRQEQEFEKTGDTRRAQIGSGDRSERIRTYNFPQNRITDHRIGLTLHQLDRVMEGEIAPLLDALREQHVAMRLKREQASLGGLIPPAE